MGRWGFTQPVPSRFQAGVLPIVDRASVSFGLHPMLQWSPPDGISGSHLAPQTGWHLPKSVVTQRDLKSVKGWVGAVGSWHKQRDTVAQQEVQSENMGMEKAFWARN